MKRVLFITMTLVLIPNSCEGCVFRNAYKWNLITPWMNKNVNRETSDSCECGVYTHKGPKPWNLFIHVHISGKSGLVCPGTLITSNLVATSHTCFLLPQRRLNLYDFWRPKKAVRNVLWDKQNISVSTTFSLAKGQTFPVQEIIYNPVYAVKSASGTFPPQFDIALLKLNSDFSKAPLYPRFRPICVPAVECVEGMDMDNIEAFYSGIEAKMEPDTPDAHFGAIEDERHKECKARLNGVEYNMDLNFCFWFEANGHPPIREGGPLFVDTSDSTTAFLLGIASIVNTKPSKSATAEYHFFTSLIPAIQYLEVVAEKHKSTWCKKPSQLSFNLEKRNRFSREDGSRRDHWPWELQTPPVTRDDSLDCVCGIPNTGGSSARVVGGVEAVPYEFAWMAVLYIYHFGRKDPSKRNSLCGGTIINDRMILSAAHCFIHTDRLSGSWSQLTPSPGDVDVYVQLHTRGNGLWLPVNAIYFHSEYYYAKKELNRFDYDVGNDAIPICYWGNLILAVLVLKTPLIFFKNDTKRGYRPICLHRQGSYEDPVGKTATVAGWGLTDPDNRRTAADELQKLDIPIIARSECEKVVGKKLTDRNLCAGTLNRYKDAASGDSGGPLMIRKGKQFYQAGIVSWGQDDEVDGQPKTAALYSDVQKLLSFIDYHATGVDAKWCRSSI